MLIAGTIHRGPVISARLYEDLFERLHPASPRMGRLTASRVKPSWVTSSAARSRILAGVAPYGRYWRRPSQEGGS